MGSNSFFTRLIIAFFIVAAIIGLAHMGGGEHTKRFLAKIHGRKRQRA